MRNSKLMLVAVLGVFGTQMAGAAPTAEEAAQLGKTLTPFGAIKAGNKDGTIPEWTGGLCKPPAGYKPSRGLEIGGGPYVDPYADEKPLFKITAANMAQYADKLDPGISEMLRRYPQTFFMNVYPTHRSACFPNWMYENTIKNVMRPKIVSLDTAPSLAGAHAQIPFPIPKMGVEVMWNSNTKVEPLNYHQVLDTWLVDSSGRPTLTARGDNHTTKPYWDNSKSMIPEDKPYFILQQRTIAPAGQVGTNQMRFYYSRQDLKGTPSYSYIPGQRRVRIAPEFSYDGVSVTSGGLMLFDEINGFDGKMDRYDFKLEGRKEIYIPYNSYTFQNTPGEKLMGPNHINQEYIRYELHRMWVVHAVLKPGERHVHKEKWFMVDEDSWNILSLTGIDQAGKVAHYLAWGPFQSYEKPEFRLQDYGLYDLTRRAYLLAAKFIPNNNGQSTGYYKEPPRPTNYFTPDSMAGAGVR